MDQGSLEFCDRVAASRWRRDPGWIPLTGDLPGAKPSAFVWKRSVIADRSIEGGDDGGTGRKHGTTVGTTRRWVYTANTSTRGRGRLGGLEEASRDWTGLDWTGGFWVGGGLRKEGSKLPFEFVGEVAGTSAVAEASDVEGGTATRHLVRMRW